MHRFCRAVIAAIAVLSGVLWLIVSGYGSTCNGYLWRLDISLWNFAFWLLGKLGVRMSWQHPLVVSFVMIPKFVSVLVVYLILSRLLPRARRESETRCRKCGYILRGITEPRCSECGEKM